MEHVLHLFGGGCGEHLIFPALITALSGGWVMIYNTKAAEQLLGSVNRIADYTKKAWRVCSTPPGLYLVMFAAGLVCGALVGILIF